MAEFELQGPDDNGDVWICSPQGRDVWCHNLGSTQEVAEAMSQWLGAIDQDEVEMRRGQGAIPGIACIDFS